MTSAGAGPRSVGIIRRVPARAMALHVILHLVRVAAMPKDLKGKVAAVTGASSGIGEATALALAEHGAAVALAARRADRIEALAARIEEAGGRALALPTDISDEDQARAFVQQANERLGRLDILVNNAGVMLLGPVEGADTDQWRQMVDVNVLGLLYCTHAAASDHARAGLGPCGQRLLRRRSRGAVRRRGLQLHEVRRVRLLRGPAPGGAAFGHPRDDHRARLRRHRAAGPQRASRSQGCDGEGAGGGRDPARPTGHRRRDPLRRHATTERERQRGS